MRCKMEEGLFVRFMCGLFVISAVSHFPSAQCEDWPCWTGPVGINASPEQNLPRQFDSSKPENVKWVRQLGGVAFGCPTVSQGKLFIGTNCQAVRDDPRFSETQGGVVVCLDAFSGEILWRLVTPVRFDGFPPRTHLIHQRYGICSSPAVDGKNVYVLTNGDDVLCLDSKGLTDGNAGPFLDEAGFMAALNRPPVELSDKDGDIIWRYDIPREVSVAPHDVGSCSVLIHEDSLYTSTSNGIGTGSPVYALMPEAPAFLALDKRDGHLLAIENEGISARLFHAQWSSPSQGRVGNRDLIFLGGADGVCYAFRPVTPDHSRKDPEMMSTVWRYDCNPSHYKTRNGKRIYYYQGDVRVYRNKRRSGEATEGFNSNDGLFVGPNEIIATPVFFEDRVYVATGRDPSHGLGKGVLHCIDAAQTGDITSTGCIWRYEGIGRSISTVAIENGLVYAADLAGRLHCLDAETGELHWIHDTEQETWANPLVADGKVYLNTRQAFWIFAASIEKRVLSMHRGGSECPPIAANGIVYAFLKGRLYALEVSECE